MILEEGRNLSSGEEWIIFDQNNFNITENVVFSTKVGFQSTTVNQVEKYSKMLLQYSTKINNNTSTLISTAYALSLAGNIVVCTPSQGTNRKIF